MKKRNIFKTTTKNTLNKEEVIIKKEKNPCGIQKARLTSNDPFSFRINNSSHWFSVYIERPNFLFSFFFPSIWKLNSWKTYCKVSETIFCSFERWGKSDVSFCRLRVSQFSKRYVMLLVSFSSNGIHGIYGHVITIFFSQNGNICYVF